MSIFIVVFLAILAGIVVYLLNTVIIKIKERKIRKAVEEDSEIFFMEEFVSLINSYTRYLEKEIGVDFAKDPALPLFTLNALLKDITRDYLLKKSKIKVDYLRYVNSEIVARFLHWIVVHKNEYNNLLEENLSLVENYLLNISRKIVEMREPEKVEIFDKAINMLRQIF